MTLSLSVVIPAHNEGARLERGFERLLPAIEPLGFDNVEILVVDDGSSVDTGQRASALLRDLPHSLVIKLDENQGKGGALKLGVSVAQGSRVVTCDADAAINPTQLPTLLAALEHADLAVGSRAVDGAIRYDSHLRTVAGSQFNRLVRKWTGSEVRDTQCGFKGFQQPLARLFAIFGHIDGFAFDAEWLYLAGELGLTTVSVPVDWDDVEGSTVSLGRHAWSMLRDIREIRKSPYRTVGVRVAPGTVDVDAVATASRQARMRGIVLARGEQDDIVVLPRDGAPGALGIAKVCNGDMGLVGLSDLRNRHFESL